MKKISLKKTIFAVSLVLVTGFSTYALANMGAGSHMGGGYSGSNYAMNHGNDYNNNHMGGGNGYGRHMNNGNHNYNSGQMGYGMDNDGHMFNNQDNRTQNHRYDDMNKSNNNQNHNNSDSIEE